MMANKVYNKSIRRTIFGSMGRYIAILAIVALGVAFFGGVKDTRASMLQTLDKYVTESNMYDYKLISTLGFTDEDVDALRDLPETAEAEGSVTNDFFSFDSKENSVILRAHTLTGQINKSNLVSGKMPQNGNECVVDGHVYSNDDIGKIIKVSDENTEETKDVFAYSEYKIVGIVNNPSYLLRTERGTGTLGDGTIKAYIYIPEDGFDTEYFTEVFVTCKSQGFVYSEEYDKNIESAEASIKSEAEKRGEIRYNDIVSEAMSEIEDGQKKIDDGRAELESEKSKAYAKLKSSKQELDQNKSKLESGAQQIAETRKQLDSQKQQLQAGISEANKAYDDAKASGMVPDEQLAAMAAQIAAMQDGMAQIDAGYDKLQSESAKIDSGRKQLDDGYSKYYSGKKEAEKQFADADKKLNDSQAELDDAKKELDELEHPELYVQTRSDNIGYDSFDSNSAIVDSIAKVFPVFFFLIAALVCSTTMTRMIEDERVQIGSLRAMGYTRAQIMRKYMVYSGSAAIIGCVIGFFAGSKFFPYAIWIAYGMLFGFAPIEFYFNWPLAIISLIVAVICSVGTTYVACRGLLGHSPAEILRPAAPKAGKRILLERIGFIWNKLKFLHKVTARNIFRYKKRMIMMVLGIGGCTALIIAGFGIRDSIAGIADKQFDEIEVYDMTVAFSKELTAEELGRFDEACGNDAENIAALQQMAVSAKSDKTIKSCTLMISDDSDITDAVVFKDKSNMRHNRPGGSMIDYPGKGEAIVTNKLAEMLGLKVGDKVTVEYDSVKSAQLTVSGIYRNYVSNYIYINSETYEQTLNKTYEPDLAFVTVKDGVDVYDVSSKINEYDGVIGIAVNQDMKNRVDDMMVSLNSIILLVIVCAAVLAFIVLFNLGNINITEREREIATLKVLGFYPGETGSYVFRESFVLVVIGIVVGIPAGYFLHKFIMAQITFDMISFEQVIKPVSYVYAAVMVVVFAVIVDMILRRKIRRINMAEALKSIE